MKINEKHENEYLLHSCTNYSIGSTVTDKTATIQITYLLL